MIHYEIKSNLPTVYLKGKNKFRAELLAMNAGNLDFVKMVEGMIAFELETDSIAEIALTNGTTIIAKQAKRGTYTGPVIANTAKADLVESEKNFQRTKRREYVGPTDAEIIEHNDKRIEARRERLGCGRKGGYSNGPGKALTIGVHVEYVNNNKLNRPRLANDKAQIHVLQEVYKGAEQKYQDGLKDKLKYSRLATSEGKGNRTITKHGKRVSKLEAHTSAKALGETWQLNADDTKANKRRPSKGYESTKQHYKS